jgi:hypothetical protein
MYLHSFAPLFLQVSAQMLLEKLPCQMLALSSQRHGWYLCPLLCCKGWKPESISSRNAAVVYQVRHSSRITGNYSVSGSDSIFSRVLLVAMEEAPVYYRLWWSQLLQQWLFWVEWQKVTGVVRAQQHWDRGAFEWECSPPWRCHTDHHRLLEEWVSCEADQCGLLQGLWTKLHYLKIHMLKS